MPTYDSTHARIDLAQLADLFRSAGWDFRASDPIKLAELLAGSRYVISAQEGDRLIGFARAISDGVTNAYVATVAVLPDHRGRGIGTELVRRLMEGHDTLRFVLHARPELHPFYRRLGFETGTDLLVRNRRS